MNRILWIIILGMLLQYEASAQNYFNKRLTLHSFTATMFSVIEDSGRYYTASGCIDSINYIGGSMLLPITGTRLSVFDDNGSLLIDSFTQREDRLIAPQVNALVKYENNILMPAYGIDTSGHAIQSLYKWSENGRLLRTREYDKPYCYTVKLDFNYWALKDLKQDSFGNWIILSEYVCGIKYVHAYTNTMLTKLDSNFNVLWNVPLDDTFSDHSGGHLVINKDNYIISGNIRSPQSIHKNFHYQAEIFKTDTSGRVLWHWKSDPKKLTNTAMDIVQTADGGFVYCGQGDGVEVSDGPGTTPYINWYPTIDKIDSSGNAVWHQKLISGFPSDETQSNISILKELPNGDIMAAGNLVAGYNPEDTISTYGTLVKLSANGKIKWKRQYQYYDSDMIYTVYDMKQTSDGGYIMAGEALDVYYPYTYPIQQAWLLKVDSNGCTSLTDPQCHPTAVKPVAKTAAYKVYPNPAHSVLSISAPVAGSFLLTDISGRALLQAKLWAGAVANIPLEHLAAGVYFYRII
ncbi:MAG: T9SS type A sorting domain-containing protein, partial [Chitinophagaceae bacterium]